jgi:transposase
MKLKSNQPKASAEQMVKDIRSATRRQLDRGHDTHCSERLAGLRHRAELCRKEGIAYPTLP